MTYQTVTLDRLEELSFETGAPIEAGDKCDHLTLKGKLYCAPRQAVGA